MSERAPEEIREEIDETREDLGDTVEALAAKTDVKARGKEKADEVKDETAQKVQQGASAARENAPVVIGVVTAIAVAWYLRRRHR